MDEQILPPLTPREAMNALTQAVLKAAALQADLELTRLAIVGATTEAITCKVPLEDLPAFFEPPLGRLMSMYTEAGEVAELARDAGLALHPLVEAQSEGTAA
jgi:hypothetical protein